MASRPRFPLVDSMRAVAAIGILAYHAVGYWAGGLSHPGLARFLARLDLGVPIFLVISGFVLYRPFAHAAARDDPLPSLRSFAWRRFLRIVPAYWVALTICALALSLPGVFSRHGLLTYYGFGQLYSAKTIGGGIAPAWTLDLEVTFYAVLPLYAIVMRRLRAELWGVAALVGGSLAYKAIVFATGAVSHPGLGPDPLLVNLPGYLDMFGLGIGLAVLSVRYEGRALPRGLAALDARPGLAWLAAGAAFLVASLAAGLPSNGDETFTLWGYLARNALYGVIAVGLLVPAVFGQEHRVGVRRIMAAPLLVWLGLISYGIYLWHWPLLVQLNRWGWSTSDVLHPYLRWGLSGLILAVTLGALSFYLVERPALSLKRLVRGGPAPWADPVPEPVVSGRVAP